MRLELQFSSCFLADYFAAKIVALIAGKLPVGTTLPIGSVANYVSRASPTIINRGSGVVGIAVVFDPLPALQIDLSATTDKTELTVTATLVNRDEIVGLLSSLNASIDPSLIPSSLTVPVDLTSIVGPGQPAPTRAGFAADINARVVALRVELGAADPADDAAWTIFLGGSLMPAFKPGDITVDPPREWAAILDWQIVKMIVDPLLVQQVKARLTGFAADASMTGSFAYAWGLSYGDEASGFAGRWPFDPKGAFDLDAICPVHGQGHDGYLYVQIAFSAIGRNRLNFGAKVGAQVWCCWQDVGDYDFPYPFGDFAFDGNALEVDAISTDARGVTVRGEAVLDMPLAFPTPSVNVGNFTWILEDACNTRSLAQTVGVYLTGTASGWSTPLRGRLTVATSMPKFNVKVESFPPLDDAGIGTAPQVWAVTVARDDLPAGGGEVTLSVETNAGQPQFPSGPSVSLALLEPLSDAAVEQMELAAVTTCASATHAGYVKKFVPAPPEEMIWWNTQELLLAPPTERAGAPTALAGPVTLVAVPKSGLVDARREQKKNPHGVVQRPAIGMDGIRVVVRRLELSASATAAPRDSRGSQRRSR
jgi:hypothetical protein